MVDTRLNNLRSTRKKILFLAAVIIAVNILYRLLLNTGDISSAKNVLNILRLFNIIMLLCIIINAWYLSIQIGGIGTSALLILMPFVNLVYLAILIHSTNKFINDKYTRAEKSQ